jgi:Metallo-peptidase family M12
LNNWLINLLTPPALAAFFVGAVLFARPILAQDLRETSLWQKVQQGPQGRSLQETWVRPNAFRAFRLQHSMLRPLLKGAPKEASQAVAASRAVISLPMPDGTEARFRFVESPVMHPDLAARFPEIKTYVGRGIDDPAATVRFDLTPVGFHAQILSPRGAVYVEPYLRGDTNLHAVYARRDYSPAAPDFQCRTDGTVTTMGSPASQQFTPRLVSGGDLRTYRLACAATAEYTTYFGGTVSAGLAAIVTAINRVTGVYESELGIRLELVAGNDLIIYTNTGAEPYSNGNPTSLLRQNQANIDAVIGSTNYDIGHVFSTAGGGLAGVGVACVAGIKAQGETGTYPPVVDAFFRLFG